MKRFSPEACFDIIQQKAITSITQTPTMYRMLLQTAPERRLAGAGLSRVITGASAMSPAERQELRKLFPNAALYDIYSQTKAGRHKRTNFADFLSRPESVGKPMPGVRVAIIDENGRKLPPGSIGEITCQGRNVMQGYFRNETATKMCLCTTACIPATWALSMKRDFCISAGRKKTLLSPAASMYIRLKLKTYCACTRRRYRLCRVRCAGQSLGRNCRCGRSAERRKHCRNPRPLPQTSGRFQMPE